MYYAITIKDGLITGRHENTEQITEKTFSSGVFAGQKVMEIKPDTQYESGFLLAEFDKAGKLRPIVDRIQEGLTPMPAGYEITEGELVKTQVPEAEAPPKLMARVKAAEQKAQQVADRLEEVSIYEVRRAGELFAQSLAETGAADSRLMEVPRLFPSYDDFLKTGQTIKQGLVIRDGENAVGDPQLYRVMYDITPNTAKRPSGIVTAFTPVGLGKSGYPIWVQPLWWLDAYQLGDTVDHKGVAYISNKDNNMTEPSATSEDWDSAP